MAYTFYLLPLQKGNSLSLAMANKRILLAIRTCRLYSVALLGEYSTTSVIKNFMLVHLVPFQGSSPLVNKIYWIVFFSLSQLNHSHTCKINQDLWQNLLWIYQHNVSYTYTQSYIFVSFLVHDLIEGFGGKKH